MPSQVLPGLAPSAQLSISTQYHNALSGYVKEAHAETEVSLPEPARALRQPCGTLCSTCMNLYDLNLYPA